MSVIRREALRYIHDNGPIKVGTGQAARQVAVSAILDVLQEEHSMGTRGSVQYAILELVEGRALEEGGTGAGQRFNKRHYLGITDVGRRELAVKLYQAGEELSDDLKPYVNLSPDLEAEDPIDRLRERQRDLENGDDAVDDAVDDERDEDARIADLEATATHYDTHDVSDEIEAGERVVPEPQIDYDALAQMLLAKVMQATRDSDQWADEVQRLEAELAAMRQERDDADALHAQTREADFALMDDLKRQLRDTERERDEAKRNHAKANERIREITAEAERRRGPNGNALREEDRRALQDFILSKNIMEERPTPGPVNAGD